MKVFLLLIALYFINISADEAQIKTPDSLQKNQLSQFLFEKSGKQKKTAWILLGAGAGVALIGYGIGMNAINNANEEDLFFVFAPEVITAALINLVGEVAMVASVPFFIASGRNKKKARIILKNETQSFVVPSTGKKNFVSVGFQLNM